MLYNPELGVGIVKNVTSRHLAAHMKSDEAMFWESELKFDSEHEYFMVPGTLDEVLRFANQVNSYEAIVVEVA